MRYLEHFHFTYSNVEGIHSKTLIDCLFFSHFNTTYQLSETLMWKKIKTLALISQRTT